MRNEVFGVDIDEDLRKAIGKTLHSARVTLTENKILEAVIAADTNLGGAKDAINAQIIAWNRVNIAFDDVQPKLWLLAQGVCSGKPLKD